MLLKQIRLHRDVIANSYNKRNTFLRKKKSIWQILLVNGYSFNFCPKQIYLSSF